MKLNWFVIVWTNSILAAECDNGNQYLKIMKISNIDLFMQTHGVNSIVTMAMVLKGKRRSSRYKDSHYEHKMVVRPSYLYSESLYTRKTCLCIEPRPCLVDQNNTKQCLSAVKIKSELVISYQALYHTTLFIAGCRDLTHCLIYVDSSQNLMLGSHATVVARLLVLIHYTLLADHN